jgi:methylphosphotriester-DNA--protein-cysteine methyltransferase
MINHSQLLVSTFRLIRSGEIKLAGNARLKIYGRLDCYSGKRMKKENRVFFNDETEALSLGYRACQHCMKKRHADLPSGNAVP